jgi:hypothetical protein
MTEQHTVRVDAELSVRVTPVNLFGLERDLQFSSDNLGGKAPQYQLHDGLLARSEYVAPEGTDCLLDIATQATSGQWTSISTWQGR